MGRRAGDESARTLAGSMRLVAMFLAEYLTDRRVPSGAGQAANRSAFAGVHDTALVTSRRSSAHERIPPAASQYQGQGTLPPLLSPIHQRLFFKLTFVPIILMPIELHGGQLLLPSEAAWVCTPASLRFRLDGLCISNHTI